MARFAGRIFILALALTSVSRLGRGQVVYSSAVWDLTNSSPNSSVTGTLNGVPVTWSSQGGQVIAIDTNSFRPPSWSNNPATNNTSGQIFNNETQPQPGAIAYTSSLGLRIFATNGVPSVATQTVTFGSAVANPVLLVRFVLQEETTIQLPTTSFHVLSCNATGSGTSAPPGGISFFGCGYSLSSPAGFTIYGGNGTVLDGFAVQLNGTYGPSNPLVFSYTTTNAFLNDVDVTIAVLPPPVLAAAFFPSLIASGGTSTLSFSLTNPNATDLTGLSFTETLDAGLVVASPNGLSGVCNLAAGGFPFQNITATPGSNTISLSGGALRGSSGTPSVCGFSVNVVGNAPGTFVETTSPVTSDEATIGSPASAQLHVALAIGVPPQPPTVFSSFSPARIPVSGTSTLTFGLEVGGLSPLEVAFTDTLPASLAIANPSGLTTTCGFGNTQTITANPGGNFINVPGIPVFGACSLSVNVIGTAPGTFTNTTSPPTDVNGTGQPATATITVGNTITASAGNPQSAPLNTQFPFRLEVTVIDSTGNYTNGAAVTFSAPLALGGVPTAMLSSSTAIADPTGRAFVYATANGTAGSYVVTATVANAPSAATFVLSNVNASNAPGTCQVNSGMDDNSPGSLRYQVAACGKGGTITFAPGVSQVTLSQQQDIQLTQDLTIDGGGALIFGSQSRIFFIRSGSITLRNLVLAHGTAQGGKGGDGVLEGGGGAGMGGAIFLNAGTLTAGNVAFSSNIAQGGNGGNPGPAAAGGGGGAGGNGGSPVSGFGNGGGGGDFGNSGGSGTDGSGGDVLQSGDQPGGFGGGGVDGATGPAGFGGGGGSTAGVNAGGRGAFGGGGGTSAGGGAGLGGAIFARSGFVTLNGVSFARNLALRGRKSGSGAQDGQGKGGALLVMPQATVVGFGMQFRDDSATDGGINTPCNTVLGAAALDGDACGVFLTATASVTGGSNQSTYVNAGFSNPLVVTVTSGGNPVPGLTVTFSGPASGASLLQPIRVTTDANGLATAFVTANGIVGGPYMVTASVAGVPLAGITFSLANLAIPPIVITWAKPADIAFGSALGPSQLNATANMAGTFVYTPPAGTVLPVGINQTLSAMFTPTDSVHYNPVSASTTINVVSPSRACGGSVADIQLTPTWTLTRNDNSLSAPQIDASIVLSNAGFTTANNVQITAAKIGSTSVAGSLPIPLSNFGDHTGSVACTSLVSFTLIFLDSALPSGISTTMTISGTYTGGSFTATRRVVLP